MSAWQRAQRNRRTTKVNVALQSGRISDAERPAVSLLVEGDLALELLIVTASESFEGQLSRRRDDEKALTRRSRTASAS